MKVLITGAKGQLGNNVRIEMQAAGCEVIAVDVDDLDLLKTELIADQISEYNADWVINCAAYTQVDRAEDEPDMAFSINRDAAREIATGVSRTNGNLLHISTDYIFDGKKNTPYKEDDEAKPLSIYGASKLEGENEIRLILPNALILRTAWVYGVFGNNFVKTILQLASNRSELKIVSDQVGSPTWAFDIARTIAALINMNESGTYNFTSQAEVSWYDFACEILNNARQLDYKIVTENVVPISTSEYPAKAVRPKYSALSNEKINNLLGSGPEWKKSLYSMISLLKNTNPAH